MDKKLTFFLRNGNNGLTDGRIGAGVMGDGAFAGELRILGRGILRWNETQHCLSVSEFACVSFRF